MAKTVGKFPHTTGKGVFRYPWDEWLNGEVWELVAGKDFTALFAADFRPQVYRMAKQHGCLARTQILDNKLYVQAVDRD